MKIQKDDDEEMEKKHPLHLYANNLNRKNNNKGTFDKFENFPSITNLAI